jgi:hypothetical protein
VYESRTISDATEERADKLRFYLIRRLHYPLAWHKHAALGATILEEPPASWSLTRQ